MNLALPLNIEYKKTLNYLIIAYAFCLPLSKAGTSFFEILIILIWLYNRNFINDFYKLKESNFIIILFAFLSFSILSMLWSDNKLFAIDYIRKYWHFLIIPLIYLYLKPEFINKIFSAFLLGMLISEVTSYGIFFELWTKEGVSPNDPSPFMNHTHYSIYLAFTIFILLLRIIHTKKVVWKIPYLIFFIFSTSNLFLNGGRTGQVIFFISIILFGFFLLRDKIKGVLIMLLLSSSTFIVAYNVSPIFKDRYYQTMHDVNKMFVEKDFTGSFSARVGLWITGLEGFIREPILGTGIGDETVNNKELIEKRKLTSFYHNDTEYYIDYHGAFIQYLVQLGIIGFVLFVSIFIALIRLKIRSKKYKHLSIMFTIVFSMSCIVGDSFHNTPTMLLFALFSGVFISLAKKDLLMRYRRCD